MNGCPDPEVLALACELIARPSLTPDDAGCQALIGERLQRSGFRVEHLRFGAVDNLWATHGAGAPLLCLLGHTDVVPAGPLSDWHSDPFTPSVRAGRLYGRGAADMKGSVAAFVLALERFVAAHPGHPGTVALLLTSDEEGDALNGVRKVAETFAARGTHIDWCLVGEPSSHACLGDVVRIGRRGSLTGRAVVRGVQGHVAYPDLADNPIHRALPVFAELVARTWDEQPYPDFPRTTLQIVGFAAGAGASNVIPATAEVTFNFRYAPSWSAERLIQTVGGLLSARGVDADLQWQRSGEPFHTGAGPLREAVRSVLYERLGRIAEENTGGGTSDGRFMAPLGAQVVELGPVNASIHKIDEWIDLQELAALAEIYQAIVARLLSSD